MKTKEQNTFDSEQSNSQNIAFAENKKIGYKIRIAISAILGLIAVAGIILD